ncbi:T9SS type A sorting domain-containing protein [Tamlana sp. 2201CG12-4]|uniref:T9SS type A sorting domain-containing protein n=1 Tax=Tamlana sp. 2201CG12-4 TaxID=3112582 RepID=UPI003FA368D7
MSKDLATDSYKVISILGNTVKEVKATGSLDVSDLSKGIYFLITDSGIAKFVKK